MSLLNAITPILNSKTAKVTLEISANTKVAGELVVIARPIVGPVSDQASNELKQLCAALATPLKAIGTPETIEAELYAVVNEQAAHRTSWASRAAEMESMIQQAAQKDTKAAGAKPAKPESKSEPEETLPIAGATKTNDTPAPDSDDNMPLEL